MIRIFILYILPILLPSLMYFGWIAFVHKNEGEAPGKSDMLREGPWFRLIFAGLGLMMIGLVLSAIMGGMSPEGQYQPPYTKDGKIVPGRMVPKE